MSNIHTTATNLGAEIAKRVKPILEDYEIEALLAEGWIRAVLHIERHWSDIVALAMLGDDPDALESLPRARLLRVKARKLVETPRLYVEEEMI